MNKIFIVLQILIKCFLIFLIAFVWLRFVLDSMWLALILSFGITLIIELVSVFLKKKKGVKNYLKSKEKEDAENMFLSLIQDKNNLDFFYRLASSRHNHVSKNKNYIIIKHEQNQTKVALVPYLKIQSLTADDILEIVNFIKIKVNKIVVVCNEYEKNLDSFIKNFAFEIVTLNKYETYENLYKEYDFFPEITIRKKINKYTFKDLMAYSFNRSRAKGYIISALMLFILSFFVKISLYYCIVASLLLLFALISFTNQTYNKKIKNEIL